MPLPAKRIVIIAGEESGDIHAANIVRELKKNHQNLQISGIGGRHMENAGVELISDLARYAVTGFSEILRHIIVLRRGFKAIKIHLATHKPDLLVLVDYPGFNLRLLKFVKALGIRTIYYISPQIWAWKAGRIKLIKECVDHMAVILPFEKKIYEQAGVPVSFVGHPLVEKVTPNPAIQSLLREKLGLPNNKRIIALLPGSRVNEVRRHMPVLIRMAMLLNQQFDDLHFAIPVAGNLQTNLISSFFTHLSIPITLIREQAVETVSCSDCVVVASGTASLECALLEKPMCIIYKVSHLTYMAAFFLMKVKYLGLCNLLQNAMIVPELLQYDCNPKELVGVVSELLNDKDVASRMQIRLERLRLSLSAQQADCTITQLVESKL